MKMNAFAEASKTKPKQSQIKKRQNELKLIYNKGL